MSVRIWQLGAETASPAQSAKSFGALVRVTARLATLAHW
jgi:hypothetical protein